jgi:hypothetical protein
MGRQKAPLPFATWAPDTGIISGTAAEAKGVIRLAGRYVPDKSFQPLLEGASIGDIALGGGGFYQDRATARVFVADKGNIYELVARHPIVRSRIGGYTADEDWAWTFEQFGSTILAAGKNTGAIQKLTMGSDTNFSDLTGNDAPTASDGIFIVRQFVFSGKDDQLVNSAFNNYADWTPDSGTQSGSIPLQLDGGNFVRGLGGQFAMVFQERRLSRLTYVGGTDSPFQIDTIEDKIGAMGPNAVCKYGATAYFVTEDGIRVTDGNASQTVGDSKINRYFASRLNYAARARVSIAADVEKRLLKIAFPAGNSARCNEVLIYSIADGEWTHDDIECDLLFEAPRPGVAIDDDAGVAAIAGSSVIDDVAIPVDSLAWRESRKQIMGVDYTGQVGTFEGPNRPAIIETGFAELAPGRKGFVSEIWPLTDAATCAVSVTSKLSRLSDTTINNTLSSMNTLGFCPVMVEARWLRAQLQIPYATDWTEALGIDHDASVSGEL